MVVFTCNHCGDSLHKPGVEKHYNFVCRNIKFLTCVDCLKDFRGEEYVTHTKCLTEDERYAAKGTFTNGIIKKGEVKQETWVEMINSILNNTDLKPSCRNLLNAICNYSNIPRKKHKFINFIKSSSGGRVNMKDVEEVWNVIEKYKNDKVKSDQNANSNNKNPDFGENQNGSKINTNMEEKDLNEATIHEKTSKKRNIEENKAEKNTADIPKKKKKHESKETSDKSNDEIQNEKIRFNFQENILEIVNAKGSLSLKKLQKKVLNAYLKETGEIEVTPKIIKKFNKKLKKIANIEVNEDKVTISNTTS